MFDELDFFALDSPMHTRPVEVATPGSASSPILGFFLPNFGSPIDLSVSSNISNPSQALVPSNQLLAVVTTDFEDSLNHHPLEDSFHPSPISLTPSISPTISPSKPLPSLPSRMVTRSQTDSLKPKQFPDYKVYSTKYPLQALPTVTLPLEPTTYSQAAKNKNWYDAMQAKFNALLTNKNWTLCPRPPAKKVVRNKWVFKLKQKPNGSIDRYKARLVAKGFDQELGIDFNETFSLVIKPAIIRLILALAAHHDRSIRQLNISNQ